MFLPHLIHLNYFFRCFIAYLMYMGLHLNAVMRVVPEGSKGGALADRINSRRESSKAHGQKNNHIIQIFGTQAHPLTEQLLAHIAMYSKGNITAVDESTVFRLMATIANDYATLLLYERTQDLFSRIVSHYPPHSEDYYNRSIGLRATHILAVLSFAEGNLAQANHYWSSLQEIELLSQRSRATQLLMTGPPPTLSAATSPSPTTVRRSDGIGLMAQYAEQLGNHFLSVLNSNVSANTTRKYSNDSLIVATTQPRAVERYTHFSRSSPSEESDEFLLSMLLSEAQSVVRLAIPLTDLRLCVMDIRDLDARQRFRLGVGLAKLGLFDLSLKHVWMAATPWEAPLYKLRAKLVFSPVHDSMRSLAAAVDNFERQAELILLNPAPMQSSLMRPICNSLNEAALALQSLPLLHLAGFAAPRYTADLGHSPAALPILLGEVFQIVCPLQKVSSVLNNSLSRYNLAAKNNGGGRRQSQKDVFTIGIVSGSFDGLPGKVVIGLLESMSKADRKGFRILAMCFPTPRDATTDRVMPLFDGHVNLSPYNKTQSIERIIASGADYILFADAGLDSRVFAISHERLALWQGLLWSWGGTLGIPTVDHYFVPEILWRESQCPTIVKGVLEYQYPQKLFAEQVILLEGLPFLPRAPAMNPLEVQRVLQTRYLLQVGNDTGTRVYLFPQSVKHMHPEFDQAVEVILKADPLAVVVLAVARAGRDNLPPTHIAVRHDLMHPVMPVAAAAKLRQRLKPLLGRNIRRFRVLPPLEESLLRGLMRLSIAVLDSYPVGMHIQILEAMLDGIPVISAFALQECTNSHAYNIARFLNISSAYMGDMKRGNEKMGNGDRRGRSPQMQSWDALLNDDNNADNFDLYPTSPEEFGVLAFRLSRERNLRRAFVSTNKDLGSSPMLTSQVSADEEDNDTDGPMMTKAKTDKHSQGAQMLQFFKTLRNSYSSNTPT